MVLEAFQQAFQTEFRMVVGLSVVEKKRVSLKTMFLKLVSLKERSL